MAKPFHNAIMGMKENMTNIKDSFELIKNVLEPIIEEVEDSDNFTMEGKVKRADEINPNDPKIHDTEYYQKKYLNKLENRCNEQLIRGEKNCENSFQDLYRKCYEKLPLVVNHLLCWPMKIDYVCNIAETVGSQTRICDPTNKIDSTFGENYSNLKNLEKNLLSNFSKVEINYSTVKKDDLRGLE